MKKIFLLLVGFGLVVFSYAQNTVNLTGSGYVPNSTYKGHIINESSTSVLIDADSATLQKMKDKGVENPIKKENDVNMISTVTTGALNENHIPLTITISDSASPEFKFTMYGNIPKDSLPHLDSLTIEPKTKEMEQAKESIFETLKGFFNNSNIHYPNKDFCVGDTATNIQNVPISMMGMKLNLQTNTLYKLIKIENDLAYFNLSEVISMKLLGEKNLIINGNGEGMGSGQAVYNIKNKFLKNLRQVWE